MAEPSTSELFGYISKLSAAAAVLEVRGLASLADSMDELSDRIRDFTEVLSRHASELQEEAEDDGP